ncbi:aldehyde dehydrogenase family protein [Amycolatopsis rubida]|uniref:Acyl-CoA reductase n=1 Tax=Amycolatopsis rubida TaxID=112413 RepID=A0A1I5ZGP9_9PSEU|nr:aldehyde dehydrogenase family protein [Amycolatopsis rubida]SFQ55287.1 Acyl-CoA reductase [Amycolatopsis rubida]
MTSTVDRPLSGDDRAAMVRHALEREVPGGIGICSGQQVHPGRGDRFPLHDPTSHALVTEWPDPGREGADLALAAAVEGFARWTALGPAGRADALRTAAQLVEARAGDLARLETLTTGKPLRDTTAELRAVVTMLKFYGGWAERINGETLGGAGSWHAYSLLQPFGVIVAVTPWNAPLLTAAANGLPALAAGNAVVVKPSEFTPASTIRFAQILHEAGLPLGAFVAAPGLGATVGAALTTDRRVGKVVFIGSVGTGRAVASASAAAGIPSILELGGKSANVVFADAGLDDAAAGALSAVFSGTGQSCQAGSRLLVQDSIRDKLLDRIVAGARVLRVGDPLDPETELGPIVHRAQYERVRELVALGVAEGARQLADLPLPAGIATGPMRTGNWCTPVLLDGVAADHSLEHTEVFGPVLAIDTFSDENEALARANGTEFGLASAVWTRDVARAHRFASAIQAGTCYVNCYKVGHPSAPFGGFKSSGWGRASGRGVVEEFTQSKAVWVATQRTAPAFPSLDRQR